MGEILTINQLKSFLDSLACINCIHFNKECTTEKKIKNEKDKKDLKKGFYKSYKEGINEEGISKARKNMLLDHKFRSENIDSCFSCTEFKNKNK